MLKKLLHRDSIENVFFDPDISKKPNCQERRERERESEIVPPPSLCFHTALLERKHFTHDAQRRRDAISDKREAKAGGNVETLEDLASRGASNGRQRQERQKREILQWLIRSTGQLFVFLSLSLSPFPSFPTSGPTSLSRWTYERGQS